MSTSDLWTESGHNWQQLVGLPTLRVSPRHDTSTVRGMTDVDRRERLRYAIKQAIGTRTAQDVADAMDPKRSKETVSRWARGETVPSALDVGPLARALGVRPDLFVDPPELPVYPLADYLVDQAVAAGVAEGRKRSRQPLTGEAPSEPQPSPERRSASAGR